MSENRTNKGIYAVIKDWKPPEGEPKAHWADEGRTWLDEHLEELFSKEGMRAQVEKTLKLWEELGIKDQLLAKFKKLADELEEEERGKGREEKKCQPE